MQYNGFTKHVERGFIMKTKEKNCPKCGAELVDAKAKICPACGQKIGKPIFKKWWFWLIVVLGLAIIGASTTTGTEGEGDPTQNEVTNTSNSSNSSNNSSSSNSSNRVTYEKVDLQEMMDALEENALKAEKTYQNKYIEVTGKIKNFDSDGVYITIEPVNADEWNFNTAMCYIKKDAQRDFLMEKSVGDTVTVKGKVFSIGEVLGFSMNIDEIK